MSADRFLSAGSLLLSVLLHVALGLALIFSLESSPAPAPAPAPAINSLAAVSVDKTRVERELSRLRQKENADKAAEARRKQELAQLIRQRKTEQERLKQIKQAREAEAREAEAARIRRREREELEKKRRIEREQKAAAEREKREAEREKQAAERREAERRRQEQQRFLREQQLRAELEAEQQARQDQAALAQYTGLIIEAVAGRFNRLGLPGGLSCVLRIRMLEGGQVADVAIVRSSGNALFDSRAETAVRAASPLPAPADARLFEKMRNIRFTFEP